MATKPMATPTSWQPNPRQHKPTHNLHRNLKNTVNQTQNFLRSTTQHQESVLFSFIYSTRKPPHPTTTPHARDPLQSGAPTTTNHRHLQITTHPQQTTTYRIQIATKTQKPITTPTPHCQNRQVPHCPRPDRPPQETSTIHVNNPQWEIRQRRKMRERKG
jgi:hypothetical protein